MQGFLCSLITWSWSHKRTSTWPHIANAIKTPEEVVLWYLLLALQLFQQTCNLMFILPQQIQFYQVPSCIPCMCEYPSVCLHEFCFLLISVHSVFWSERRWTSLFICKMLFDVTSVSLLSLSFHPTSSYSSLTWARNVELDFQSSLLLQCVGTETQPESHRSVSTRGRILPWQRARAANHLPGGICRKNGYGLLCWPGYGNWSLAYHFDWE